MSFTEKDSVLKNKNNPLLLPTKRYKMKNILKITLLLWLLMVAIFTQFGCTTYYGIANRGTENKYLHKPVYRDSNEKVAFVSGNIYTGSGYNYNQANQMESTFYGDISYHQTITTKNNNFAFGGAINGGNYTQNQYSEVNPNQSFFGSTLFGEWNLNLSNRIVEWRPIGFKAAIFHEQGPYADFRKYVNQRYGVLNQHPNNVANNIGITHDLIFKWKKGNIGWYSFAGFSVDFNGQMESLNISEAIHFTHDKVTGVLQFSTNMFTTALTFGIQYRLSDALIKINRS